MSDIQEEIKEIFNYFIKYANIEDSIKISKLEDYITNLQKENKKLKELCDKYEEEHNNEFQCWKRDRKELLDKRDRINKAIERLNNTIDELTEEYINYMTKQDFAKKCNISRPYLDKLLKKMNRKEIYEFCKIRNKLKGDNK